MKRTILIHTFGGVLLGWVLSTHTAVGDYTFDNWMIMPLWGGLGAILLYESLRPYFPRLRWRHMVALCVIWALTLYTAVAFLPLACGIPCTMVVLVTTARLPSVARWTGVMVAATGGLCVGIALLLQVFALPAFSVANFVAPALLGAAFGVGVHLTAHGLLPAVPKHHAASLKAQRERYFFSEAER